MLDIAGKSTNDVWSSRTRTDFSRIPVYKSYPKFPTPMKAARAPVVIVGGGPTGLTLALDLGKRGRRVVLLNQFDFIAHGSKAICFSKRTLDIWNRLGVAKRMVEKGVIWNIGKVFHGDRPEPIFQFDLLPIKDQEMPGFINLQQYYAEEFLVDEIARYPNIELRWGHEVTDLDTAENRLSIVTDDGSYTQEADWIIACDGSKSPMRTMLGLDFDGRVFEDNFLIADVRFKEKRPSERWFWFEPPWGGASALLHKQPDDVWRLDFQLGWNIDRDAAVRPENVQPLVRGMIGDDIEFEQVWYSIYTFQCRRMKDFVHGNVIFVGDAAHLVSPFGARGCNGAVANVDNLAWKLDAVLDSGDRTLIDSYNEEAIATADENILNSSRSTDFMTPKSPMSEALRNAVLGLAKDYDFARPFVNSGRLSSPVSFRPGRLVRADSDVWSAGPAPGSPAIDAPLGTDGDRNTSDEWLLSHLGWAWKLIAAEDIQGAPLPVLVIRDPGARARYDLTDGGVYLVRPDQYISARWKHFTLDKLNGVFHG